MIAADLERLVVERGLFPLNLRIRANEIAKSGGWSVDEDGHAEMLAKRDRRDPAELALGDGDRTTVELGRWVASDLDPAMTEIFIVRTVDNMLTYLTDILIEVHKTRPETLRSGAQVSYKDVLSHESMESFIEWAAEDRVESLSRKGFRQLADEVDLRLGVKLPDRSNSLDSAILLVAVRNLLVHRRGLVDRRFIEMVHSDELGKIGELVDLQFIRKSSALGNSVDMVERFDMQVAAKYGLDTVTLDARPSWVDFAFVGEPRRRTPRT